MERIAAPTLTMPPQQDTSIRLGPGQMATRRAHATGQLAARQATEILGRSGGAPEQTGKTESVSLSHKCFDISYCEINRLVKSRITALHRHELRRLAFFRLEERSISPCETASGLCDRLKHSRSWRCRGCALLPPGDRIWQGAHPRGSHSVKC